MASTQLTRTQSAGNPDVWTLSMWVKRSSLGGNQGLLGTAGGWQDGTGMSIIFNSSAQINIYNPSQGGGGGNYNVSTSVFRDTNAWYHLVFRADSTQSTQADRLKVYVNGVQDTTINTGNYPTQNTNFNNMNTNGQTMIIGGASATNTDNSFDGLISHVHFSDGYSYDASTFGETDATTGEWKIKTDPTFTLGTNGFTILQDGNTVTDQSSNSNNFSTTGTLTKTEDSPSNVFATWNPLLTHAAHGYSLTYSYGNNNILFNETSTWTYVVSTLGAISGKYYFEAKLSTVGSEASIGVIASDTVNANQTSGGLDDYLGKETDSIGYLNDGRTFKNNSAQQTGLTSLSAGSVVGVAMDLDNNTVQFYVNGASTGNAISLTADKFYHFGCSGYNSTKFETNFGNGYFADQTVSSAGTNASGNGIFEYDVPANHTALSTKGLNL